MPFGLRCPGAGQSSRFNWRPLLIASLPGIVIIGLWVNHLPALRYLSVTTMNGFHLVQHTGQCLNSCPVNALLRDFSAAPRVQIAETGSPGNTIWDAVPEIESQRAGFHPAFERAVAFRSN
jgi:hypothetical protein